MNMKKTIAAIAAGSVAVSAMATTVSALDNTELRYSLVANMWEDKAEAWGEAVITYTIENVAIPAAGTDLEINIKVPNFGSSGNTGSTWADLMKVTAVVDYNEASITDRSFNYYNGDKISDADAPAGYVKASLGSENGDVEDAMKVVLPSASLVEGSTATVKLIATFNHCADSDADIKAVVNNATVKVSSDAASAYKTVYASMGAYTKWTAGAPLAQFQGYKPLKTTINGINTTWNDDNIITYLQNRWFGTESKNSYSNVQLLLNDAIANYDSVTFTFETAKDKVNEGTGFYDAANGTDKYMAFNSNFWADYNNNVISNDWYGHNFFEGVLVVNGNLTMKLWDEQSFDWTGTSISFDWDTLTAGSMTNNDYANYLHSLNLFTSTDWYWDSMVVALADGTADDATSDAGADADDEVLDEPNTDDNEEIKNDDVADDTNETPAPEVSNPVTGNASVALAVIPVALAAAAVVAKKRN